MTLEKYVQFSLMHSSKKAIQQKYEQERLKNESEIQHLKAEIHQQLSDERAQFEDEKIQLETIIKQQQKYNKRSRFGILEDDDGERDSLLPVKASDLKKEHDSVIASINAKFEEQMATMKKMFTEEKEQDKKELAEKLDKATSQISTLRTLLKQEHELNQTRDEEVKNLMKNQKKHGGFVTPVLATAATAAAAAAASMAFSHKSPTKPEQSPTDGPWKHIQDVPQNYSEPLGPPPPAQNTTDQSSAYGPWKAIKDVPQHPESAGDGNSKDRGIGGASMAETAIKMAMSAAGGGNNGGLTETAVKMAMSAMSGGQGGGGLAQTAVKMALSSTGGGHGGGGSDVESLAASALGLALGAGVAGGRPKSPLAEMASTALNMYMGGGVGNSPGPGVTPRGIESTPRSAGGGGDTDSSDDKPLSVLAAERKSETLETEGLKALQKVPSFTEKPRSRGGSLFKQSDGPRSRDISAPNGQEPQYQYPAFLTQPQPQDQTPQYQIPAFLPPPTGPLSFTDAMALMNSNQCTPLPACPWILTQYDQTVADISTQQKEIMKQVDAELVRYGINENTVLDQWQDERVKQDVKKKWTS
ncbi:hypothetical protein BCR33DRAFT_318948 [Rhizoclosmatium globosum]|uniref:Uncharacterized protein n=1 Tax=Rhizoclosmatium globosum TaxID=329046 RepID=A0A1Y2CZN6_9FUNG|nr:hypothetical protein BCR33DRAFT_318948 [Rhizoclosmatium globosum]|eukprot:ORY52489.1 hypothetical protein BCR33DRAFT_318948 [Rhizoclosmatium globosum]